MTKPRYRLHADGRMSVVTDGLTNVVANLGTARDKAAFSDYAAPTLSPYALINAYRGAWLPRKIVDIPALDSCRKWRDWQAEADQITKIEAEERRLDLRGKVLAARRAARLFGGAALLIGTGDGDPAKLLSVESVKAGGLRYVALIHRRQLSAGMVETDAASPMFGQPAMWTINASGTQMQAIHPSRLALFRGEPLVDDGMVATDPGWGDPVLMSVIDAVRNLDATAANVASLVFEAKVDTVGIPDLMNKLGDPVYEAVLLRRWTLAETGKGINGTLMHDAEEIIGQKQASFASLPDLLDRFMQLASGAADIPITRLLGQSPAGMSSTGESDVRNYYDRVSAGQELEMGPAMMMLDECLIRSALGARPEEVHYRWASLWQISDKERADIGKTNAETVAALQKTGLIPDEPLSEAAVNLMTESGAMPGLEGAMQAFFEENPDGLDPAEGDLAPEGVKAKETDPTADAAPLSLYVRRDVRNGAEILKWAREQGFKSTLEAADLHVTIAFSRTPVDWMKVGDPWDGELEIVAGGARLLEIFGEARVLLFSSSRLSWRHEEIKNAGASWDHPEYQPHITISYDAGSPDLADVQPYRGRIVLGPEIFQTVKDDWLSGIKEAKA